MLRVLSVVGARPQFIKAALLSAEFVRRGIEEILVHTGQHYDESMSQVFFDDLDLPDPAYRLDVGSGSHGAQTGEIMKRLEPIIVRERPDAVLVYGDTNSTIAGALVAVKLHVPVVHVEAGLRSFNRSMPEEINRLVADRVADLLFVPNEAAVEQLRREGVEADAIVVAGDLQVDLVRAVAATVGRPPGAADGLQPRAYGVMTVHRASNTDDLSALARIADGVRRAPFPIVFPVHPRTREAAQRLKLGSADNVLLCDPLPYREMVALLKYARMLLTDSGGLQKEAYALRVPCVTFREETEWTETLAGGWNVLAGTDSDLIARAAFRPMPATQEHPYGAAPSAPIIAQTLLHRYGRVPLSERCAS